jgi:hypothetical protein
MKTWTWIGGARVLPTRLQYAFVGTVDASDAEEAGHRLLTNSS